VLLLLLMYLAPLVATALFWHAHRATGGKAAWEVLQSAMDGRSAHARPVAGALLFAVVLVAAAVGVRGGVAFVAGVVVAVFAAALAYADSDATLENAGAQPGILTTIHVWSESSSIALAPAALATGCVGALAWFFADPAGVVVLAAFAAGASTGALFIAMTLGAGGSRADAAPGTPAASVRMTVTSSATAALHSHLPAVAAALMVAATAEPEALLSLGGLLAESETLRSELLLLPIAISILSPVVAVLARPLVSSLLERRETASLYDVERLAAVLACLVMVGLVMASGLAWAVAAAFAVGVAARQLAVVADEASSRSIRAGRRTTPSLVPALLSAGAVALGEYLAGWYGITLAALGMTATFASAAACSIARELSALPNDPATLPSSLDLDVAEATVTVTTTLALLVAMAPVLVAESAHRGAALMLMATASPALLLGVVAGAVCAATFSDRYAESDDESDAVSQASRAVAVAAGAPVLAGILLGAGAAVGVALGFMAWAAASAPLASGPGDPASSRDRMPRSVLLAWGRTMALATLVGVPIMR